MNRTLRRGAAAAILGVSLLASLPSVATADDFGTNNPNTGTGPRADDRFHDFCSVTPWEADWGAPLFDSMVSLESQTGGEVDVQHYSSCGGGTDVVGVRLSSTTMFDDRGQYVCRSYARTNVCDNGDARVNMDYANTYATRRKTFCHEVGHSMGLTHTDAYGGCMVSGYSTVTSLSSHHVSHLKANY